jgi:Z1 domain
MNKPIEKSGKSLTYLKESMLAGQMDPSDFDRLVSKAEAVLEHLPDRRIQNRNEQGLLLGLIQSGKTGALTTVIALAADNQNQLFIVLTSDNIWLYDQTIERLQLSLPGLQIEGKDGWESKLDFMADTLRSGEDSLVLVATKNGTVLNRLQDVLDRLTSILGHQLPATLIIDDEADQASLDTKASKRAKNPAIDPGKINDLITQLRGCLPKHTYLQVTATPQALFLQDRGGLSRPEFTVLVEPGKGYTGGETFFSLIGGVNERPVRYIDQSDLDHLLDDEVEYSKDKPELVPLSLRHALCVFYVGATIKYLQSKNKPNPADLVYSFLCHVSLKKDKHDKAFEAIASYFQYLKDGVRISAAPLQQRAISDLKVAYQDVCETVSNGRKISSFEEILEQIRSFIVGTEIQVLNSEKQKQPSYSRRYNILIGGTKLARGVTIKNLLVTYYGRQTQRANMDTMLQHARMYGYREKDLDVIRLYLTEEIEERFELINDSEKALREVIQNHPGEEYRGILIGDGVSATRVNVLNPFNMGTYAAGTAYFPRRPVFEKIYLENSVQKINEIVDRLCPLEDSDAVEITIDDVIILLSLIKSRVGSGLWDDRKIRIALETLRKDQIYRNRAFLVVRKDVKRTPKDDHRLNAIVGGGQGSLANVNYPTLFLYRIDPEKSAQSDTPSWDDAPFWVPSLRFPDGNYALVFNLDTPL